MMVQMLSAGASHPYFTRGNESVLALETEETLIDRRRELLQAQHDYYHTHNPKERLLLEERMKKLDRQIKQLIQALNK